MIKTLITGGAGFIAHHMIGKILKETDWEVITLDRLDYSGNLNRLDDLITNSCTAEERKRVKVVFHDLKAELNPLVCSQIGQVDYIFHLAAGSHVDRSIDYPMEFVMDNVVGTCNILEFARKQEKLKRFIYFSTDEVFGPAPEGIKYKENDRYNSTNPYSATKAGGEELAVAYENTYGLPIYITHTMNVFGERQHPEKFIPKAIRYARDGETLTIHSNLNFIFNNNLQHLFLQTFNKIFISQKKKLVQYFVNQRRKFRIFKGKVLKIKIKEQPLL